MPSMVTCGVERPAILCVPADAITVVAQAQGGAGVRLRHLDDEVVVAGDAQAGADVVAEIDQLLDLDLDSALAPIAAGRD